MGDGTDGSTSTPVMDADPGAHVGGDGPVGPSPPRRGEQRRVAHANRRRFTVAAAVGGVLAAIPFLWLLFGPWESPDFLRQAISQTNFYDLQARAMFHGHLWIPDGRLGVEAFVHGGREFTYFGLFPSLLRMPILLVTSRLDGRLTVPSMLAAWLVTGVFVSLLLWRVRVLIRGEAVVGRAEAVSFGVLVATIQGGSVFLVLAATPYVYNEDLAWSICLTVGSLFALLGVLERPTWGRVVASGLLVLAANLDRVTTGWACVAGAILIAGWFGIGRGGPERRRWFVPMLAVGGIPLVVGCAVNAAKFGVPFGLPVTDQVYSKVNVYRQKFLAANHNSEVGVAFAPTDLLAYLRLDGLRFTSVFPFITLPGSRNPELAGVLFDKRYRTASLPSSMPLLFLLGIWGMITAFRPRPVGKVALTRLLLLAAGAACAALMLWGYIAPRYLADFVPFLVLASAVAIVDIWRRMDGRSRRARIGVLTVITLVGLFSVAANIGMASTPNEQWNPTQVHNYVEAQQTISNLTGHTLQANVHRGDTLPDYAPADQLFIIGECDGLYISNGENYSTVPSQSFLHTTWMAVERGHRFQHTFRVTFDQPGSATPGLGLVSAGRNSVSVNVASTPSRRLVRVLFDFASPGHKIYQYTPYVAPGTTHVVQVITDPATHLVLVSMDGRAYLQGVWITDEPIVVDTQHAVSAGDPPALTVTNITPLTPQPTLCQSLDR
jgi:hypothetical protein